MKTCITCGMPLEGDHATDMGIETDEGPVCKYDVKEGKMKSPEEIFEGGVEFFMSKIEDNQDLAERITRKNMKSLPYWHNHPFALLDGPVATDEEFGEVMEKL